jgi:hypothetical protein
MRLRWVVSRGRHALDSKKLGWCTDHTGGQTAMASSVQQRARALGVLSLLQRDQADLGVRATFSSIRVGLCL